MTTNIVDGYRGDNFDLPRLKEDGIIAIIHKATEGVSYVDRKYSDRRDEAKELGFLWGAFHYALHDSWEAQVDHFLETVQATASDLVSWDWEKPDNAETMSLEDVHRSIERIHASLNRYPVLYAGKLVREHIGNNEDTILKNCPLWYARYARAPIEIPPHTWPTPA
jgi:lysozyme